MLFTDYLLCKKDFQSQLRQSQAHNNRKLLNCIENACEMNQPLFHKLVKNQRSKDCLAYGTESLEYDGRIYQGDRKVIEGWELYFTDLSQPDHTGDASSSSAIDIHEKPTFSAPMYALNITSHNNNNNIIAHIALNTSGMSEFLSALHYNPRSSDSGLPAHNVCTFSTPWGAFQ